MNWEEGRKTDASFPDVESFSSSQRSFCMSHVSQVKGTVRVLAQNNRGLLKKKKNSHNIEKVVYQ